MKSYDWKLNWELSSAALCLQFHSVLLTSKIQNTGSQRSRISEQRMAIRTADNFIEGKDPSHNDTKKIKLLQSF